VPLCADSHPHVQQAPQDRARGTSGSFSSSAFSRDISSSDGSSGAEMPSKKLSSWPLSGGRRYEGAGRRATERIESNLASQSEIYTPKRRAHSQSNKPKHSPAGACHASLYLSKHTKGSHKALVSQSEACMSRSLRIISPAGLDTTFADLPRY